MYKRPIRLLLTTDAAISVFLRIAPLRTVSGEISLGLGFPRSLSEPEVRPSGQKQRTMVTPSWP
jgi:hypothetical protein